MWPTIDKNYYLILKLEFNWFANLVKLNKILKTRNFSFESQTFTILFVFLPFSFPFLGFTLLQYNSSSVISHTPGLSWCVMWQSRFNSPFTQFLCLALPAWAIDFDYVCFYQTCFSNYNLMCIENKGQIDKYCHTTFLMK